MDKRKYRKLQRLLEEIGRKYLKVEYLHGYMTAVLCAPETIMPSIWMDVVTGGEDSDREVVFDSKQQMNEYTGIIMDMHNEIADTTLHGPFKPLFSIDDIEITPEAAQTWCAGFAAGLDLWEVPFFEDEESVRFIIPVLCFSGSTEFEELFSKHPAEIIEEYKRAALSSIPDRIVSFRRYNQFGPDDYETEEEDDPFLKVGRNDLCPCGSGKKYKKCCLIH